MNSTLSSWDLENQVPRTNKISYWVQLEVLERIEGLKGTLGKSTEEGGTERYTGEGYGGGRDWKVHWGRVRRSEGLKGTLGKGTEEEGLKGTLGKGTEDWGTERYTGEGYGGGRDWKVHWGRYGGGRNWKVHWVRRREGEGYGGGKEKGTEEADRKKEI